MAKSKYEYVKEFEVHDKCLPNCWIVFRVDGRGFTKFSEKHKFKKPNDSRALAVMSAAATAVMKDFPDIVMAYGQSDEYSFVLRRNTTLFNRRISKLVSILTSAFTGYYITFWPKHFPDEILHTPPMFDGRVVTYPTDENLRDYLSWRQVDVHINNLYNTCFWNLVLVKGMNTNEAEEYLRGTSSADKNEILFSEFGINYNHEDEQHKKGTVLIRGSKKKIDTSYVDIIGNAFWEKNPELLGRDKSIKIKNS